MSTLKRKDSKVTKEAPPRSCIACTDGEDMATLIEPCRCCNMDYCISCLQDMFISAIDDPSRMAPRCCALIQIHTIIDHLEQAEAEEYREKFAEWLDGSPTYCPLPTCSTYIPQSRVPPAATSKVNTISLTLVLNEILAKVSSCQSARFFRDRMGIPPVVDSTDADAGYMDLGIIRGKIDRYASTYDMTADMRSIVSNAEKHVRNGKHPVTRAAYELFATYQEESSKATGRLINALGTAPASPLFACPKCHIAICSECKQIEHTGKPCDTTASDHEAAMLLTFGYKRCPKCHAGVKKMFGCSHMQCICGASWCWHCQQSIDECEDQGICGGDDIDDEDDYDSEDEYGDEDVPATIPEAGVREATTTGASSESPIEISSDTEPDRGHHRSAAADNASGRVNSSARNNLIVNLDAGGARRWNTSEFDFGEDPGDVSRQIWSCRHEFQVYHTTADDGFARGNLDRMECNRCFEHVEAVKAPELPEVPAKKRRKATSRSKPAAPKAGREPIDSVATNARTARECIECRLVVCMRCQAKYDLAKA